MAPTASISQVPPANGRKAERLESPPQGDGSSRERLLAAARRLIGDRGYESLSVKALVEAAGVSRQTFYNHFADKRECIAAVATDPELAEIDLRLRSAQARGSEWAPQLAKALELTLADQHASTDTPRARLLDALEQGIGERGYERTRIVDLTKAAGVSREDFYVHFADKRECLAALCGRALESLQASLAAELGDGEVELELSLAMLADALRADALRARLAIGELPHLPYEPPADRRLAHGLSFRELLEGLVARDPQLANEELERRIVVGALADAIERAVAEGRQETVPSLVAEVREAMLWPLRPEARTEAAADAAVPDSSTNGDGDAAAALLRKLALAQA